MKTRTEPRKWQGMNWIRQEKRLAIYLRDGMACAYCGESMEAGTKLTLDHIRPHVRGGSNHEHNLVTACERCNKSKNGRSLTKFAVALAAYLNHGITPEVIIRQVLECSRRPLTACILQAKMLIEARGSVARVMEHLTTP